MTTEELNVEMKRLDDLIRQASKAGLKGVKEMSKRPLSLQQMREQVARQQRAMVIGWLPEEKEVTQKTNK